MSLHSQRGASRIRRATAALCTLVLALGALTAAPQSAQAFDQSQEAQLPDENATSSPVLDAMVLRPLGLVSFVGGIALFVPVATMTLLTRPTELHKPFKMLVVDPARYVWVDPLGKH